jgi:hypothetical protein
VIEINEKGELTVRCPPYGVKEDSTADFAFISYYPHLGIWEPIFFTRNYPDIGIHETFFVFKQNTKEDWPPIVTKRVEEYKQMCKTNGLGIYTDSYYIQSNTLLQLSDALRIIPDEASQIQINSILRDTYNHVSAVLIRIDDKIIAIPVIDDGTVNPGIPIEVNWQNLLTRLAPADIVYSFYNDILIPKLPEEIRANYEIRNFIRLDKTIPKRDDIFAFHLANGLFIPIARALDEFELKATMESEEGQELPWSIDSKLVFGKQDIDENAKAVVDYKEFQEIYEHFRLTFSNYLALSQASLKNELSQILFNRNLPLFEKRQRLLIKLQPELMKWLDSSIEQTGIRTTFKRVDCRVIRNEGECNNRCVWRQEQEGGEEKENGAEEVEKVSGQCLLHIPKTYSVGDNQVDVKGLLIKKLIEELIRFPYKRKEIFNQKVSQYIKLKEATRLGNQYFFPENLYSWIEYLRMDWKVKKIDEPQYAEEFIILPAKAEAPAPEAAAPIPKAKPSLPLAPPPEEPEAEPENFENV